MITEILDSGASIRFMENGIARFVLKLQIREVEILRGTIIKIDIGQGPLNNIFVNQPDVVTPASVSVEDLRDQIMLMLPSSLDGSSTEARQMEEIAQMQQLQSSVDTMLSNMFMLNDKLFFEPKLVDESNPNVIYKGFAMPGSLTANPVWAIQRATKVDGVYVYDWAGGSKLFDKIWDDRDTLAYS